jgi:hypothetical protein
MEAVAHARLTTAAAVVVVGNVAGHLLRPFTSGVGAGRAVLFAALVLATGAWRGWQARALRDDLAGAPRDGRAAARHAALYAAGALAAALLGFAIVHGAPSR